MERLPALYLKTKSVTGKGILLAEGSVATLIFDAVLKEQRHRHPSITRKNHYLIILEVFDKSGRKNNFWYEYHLKWPIKTPKTYKPLQKRY